MERTDTNTPFWDSSLSAQERLGWLISHMTIEEKLNSLASSDCGVPRLGIPGMGLGGEAAHGVEGRNDQGKVREPDLSTSFPNPIGMSASWDPDLVREAGRITGIQARVIYQRHPESGLSRWAPTVDLERDPRWGRNEEGYGEDPLLTGEMAAAYVKGIQGDDPCYIRCAATLKHFYCNNTENGRAWKNSSIDVRNQKELYLEPFRRVIEKGGALGVMTAYNRINGVPGILNRQVQEILKKQYGLVHAVGDGGALRLVKAAHHYFGLDGQSAAEAVKAGVDGMSDAPDYVRTAAEEAYSLGLLKEKDIDEAICNTYTVRLRLGIYDRDGTCPYSHYTEEDMDTRESRQISLRLAEESIVLLRNENRILPLSEEKCGSVAAVGPLGDAWYGDWYGGIPFYHTTLREGMENILKEPVPCVSGYDTVHISCEGQYLGIDAQDKLTLAAEPELFELQDWGNGCFVFRAPRTGRYIGAYEGEVFVRKDNTLDWDGLEIFHLHKAEEGKYRLFCSSRQELLRLTGDGHFCTGGSRGKEAIVSIEKVSDGIQEVKKLARKADTVVIALGCNPMINAREDFDRNTLSIPPRQQAVMDTVIEVNKKAVLVLFCNYPYTFCGREKEVSGILWSASGSQDMGTAAAKALFGLTAPAGRLNETWYLSEDQLPDMDDYDIIRGKRTYRYFDGPVLYPFGWGLTYTDFVYSDLKAEVHDRTKIQVSFAVTNTGDMVSDEVAQVYGAAPPSRVEKPRRQLLGFLRLHDMTPGEKRRVELTVPVSEFAFYDTVSGKMMAEEGEYAVFAGGSSSDDTCSATVFLEGEKTGLRSLTDVTKADHYDDCSNTELWEGEFGYTAVRVLKGGGKNTGWIRFRDCAGAENGRKITVLLKSKEHGSILLLVNGRKAAEWEGTEPLWTKKELLPGKEAIEEIKKQGFSLEIEMKGDLNLLAFKIEE